MGKINIANDFTKLRKVTVDTNLLSISAEVHG